MTDEDSQQEEGFLERWSRVKSETREPQQAPVEGKPVVAASDAPPALPPPESLTFDSDFTAFFHPEVGEDVRRAALRKLFSDPHFNVMDGLDVYIDDYSKSEPIPAAMLAALKQARQILDWSKNVEPEAGHEAATHVIAPSSEANPSGSSHTPVAASAPVQDDAAPADASETHES